MKLTKYEHACFTVEKDGKLLLVDPGNWTTDLPALEDVVAVVITHDHPDHYDIAALGAVAAHNPNAVIFAHESITKQFDATLSAESVSAGQSVTVGPFTLEFFGGEHAEIHSSFPSVPNLGVLINNSLYYPGDSFTNPNVQVNTLALPVTAPWLKIAEVINFCSDVKAPFVFPTHDAVASDAGKHLIDTMVPPFVTAYGGTYKRLVGPTGIDG